MQRAYGWSRILATGAPAPSCTVTVYNTGTLVLATIYADNLSTPKANPFVADATSGYWFFYALSSGRYDVQFSGGGIPTPYTIGDISLSGLLTLNGLTADTQTFATGSAGTDFGISSAGSVHTFNIPSASAANRGLVTTGAQTFAGAKTFSTPIGVVSGGTGLGTAPSADGQLLIGSAGGTYTLATLTGTANQITVTNGAGSITLAAPQSIGTGSSPTFAGLTVSALTQNSFMYPGASGVLSSTAATTDGQLLIGRTGNTPLAATLTAGTGILITNGAGTIQIATTGVIASLNGLTASTQSFATGTTGNDFNISSASSTHTFNIPDASATARGVVTTGSQTLAGAKTFSGALTASSSTAAAFAVPPTFNPGTSATAAATASGRTFTSTSVVGNVGAGEDDLISTTLAANSMSANGKMVRVLFFGTLAATAASKRIRFYFGATAVIDTGALFNDSTAYTWIGEMWVIRTGAATEIAWAEIRYYTSGAIPSASGVRGATATPAADTTAAITIKATGEATNNNDITQTGMVIEVVGC